jgi:hypothetical protein
MPDRECFRITYDPHYALPWRLCYVIGYGPGFGFERCWEAFGSVERLTAFLYCMADAMMEVAHGA